jgi:hypothetical protein
MGGECRLGLLPEKRDALCPPAAMANGILHGDLGGVGAVGEKNLDCVGDGALVGVEIVLRVLRRSMRGSAAV